MRSQPWMQRFDFDPEAAVRLVWRGAPEEGGVSHFNYLRDNVLLTWMHTRLVLEFLVRLPVLALRRLRA